MIRTHLFFKKIAPVFFAIFFSDDIEVSDGKTLSSINNPCAPMKYPFGVNIFLVVSFLSKFKNFIWSLLKEILPSFFCPNILYQLFVDKKPPPTLIS